MDELIELHLTLPPSVNKMWRPVRTPAGAKLVKTKAAEQWAAEAKQMVRAQCGGARIPGQFRVLIEFPDSLADIDNRIKALLDACQHGGAVGNDRDCRGLQAEIDESREHTARLVLTPIPPERRAPAGKQGSARMEQTS